MGIGERIEYFIKKEGINANELANRVGVTSSTIYSMLKRDSSRIDIDLLIKIARALHVTTDELLSVDTNAEPTTAAAHFDGSEYTPEQLDRIREFAKFVKQREK